MEHVVFYQSAQGTPAFRRVASLDDAVSFAEHLRNVENITDFSVYSLAPVTLSLRAYYHVEVSGNGTAAAAPAGTPTQADPAPTSYPSYLDAAPAVAVDAPLPEATAPAAASPTPSLSFTALEEASTPVEQMPPPASVPFAAAPLPPAADSAAVEAFVKSEPAALPPPAEANAEDSTEHAPVDPNVVDPTTEEVVPVPPGRRSMGFFARS